MALHLMLAQAQECFYEKAVKDNMKASIIAKLAAQVADYYEFTLTSSNSPTLSSVIPKVIFFFSFLKLELRKKKKILNKTKK